MHLTDTATRGCTVVIPFREEMGKRHLKVTGDLGRIVFLVRLAETQTPRGLELTIVQEYDLRNTASIEESVRHSDVVYNLVGRDYPTKCFPIIPTRGNFTEKFRNFSLEDVHVEGTERIAEAVAKYDVDRFIHISSHNADENSASEFYRTKVEGRPGTCINGC